MTRGRPIGLRIREVCETLEQTGPSTARQVSEICQTVVFNTKKYCDRAVSHGLLTCDLSCRPPVYEVVPGWQKKIDKRRHAPILDALPQLTPLERTWRN